MRLIEKTLSLMACALALAAVMTVPVQSGCTKELTFGFMVVEPAYRYGKSNTPRGRDLEIFDQVMLQAGCSYILTKMPWKRILSAIRRGQVDVTVGASFTSERSKYAHYSLPYRDEIMVMFMRQKDIATLKPSSFTDIVNSPLNIGVHLGSWYGKQYDDAYRHNDAFRKRVLQSSDFRFLHNWLQIGRVDIVLDELYSGLNYLHAADAKNEVWIHPMPVHKNPVHFMFSRETVSKEDVTIINQSLQKFKTTARYKSLMARHAVEGFEKFVSADKQ